jgi:hypothetical protein
MAKLSVLDLVRVGDNGTPRSALEDSRAMALHAETQASNASGWRSIITCPG